MIQQGLRSAEASQRLHGGLEGIQGLCKGKGKVRALAKARALATSQGGMHPFGVFLGSSSIWPGLCSSYQYEPPKENLDVDKPEKVCVMECGFDVLVMEWGALACGPCGFSLSSPLLLYECLPKAEA